MTTPTRGGARVAAARGSMRAVLALAGALALTACAPTASAAGGCKTRLLPGDLVITEVFADEKATPGGTGTDTGKEWFEIYNASGHAIELEGLTITHSRPDGGKPNTHVVLQGSIAAGQYFTLGNASQETLPPYVDYGYGADLGDLYNTDGGKLALSCDASEIDSAVYQDVKEGHARELTSAQAPEYRLNDSAASWCQANDTEFEAGNFGTPGAVSDCQPIVTGQCSEAGALRDTVTPAPGDLVITEVMPSPSVVSDATGEWFEAKVMHDVDLNGVGLDRRGDAARPDVITSTACVHVRTGSYVVFARSLDPALNGGLPASAIVGTFKFSLVGGTVASPGDAMILAGTTVIDSVRWTRSSPGKALQLDPDLLDATANDTESNFCNATAPFGAASAAPDLGSPGAANSQCGALPSAGMCDDGSTIRPIVPPPAGQLVVTELLANPANLPPPTAVSDAQREWFEITNTGATAFDLNELTVGRIGAAGAPVQSARCISVAPHASAVLARSADPAANGGLPAVAATFGFGLVDTNGDIQISRGATVLDAVRWTSATSGVSRQLDPARLTTTDNDVATSFCAGTTAYGDLTNKGTPGAPNTPCP